MTKRLTFRKTQSALVPCEARAFDALAKVKDGGFVLVEMRRPRNLLHHRKLWALLQLVYENQSYYASPEEILTAFKLAVGHYETKRYRVNGSVVEHLEPRSISFAALSQDDFEEIYDRMVDFLVQQVIPGLNREELRQRVEEIL